MCLKHWIFIYLILLSITEIEKCTAEPFKLNLTGKATWQSSDKDEVRTSDKAVDGCKKTLGNYREGCCTHTKDYGRDLTPWWSVDLQNIYKLHSVTLVNRKDWNYWRRLDDFVIYGSKTSHDPERDDNKVVCAERKKPVFYGETKNITCAYDIEGRYIIVHRTGEVLTLCEVEVIVECPDYKYGINCCHSCSDHCRGSTCEDLTGKCDNGCDIGYQGDKCDDVCDDGFYGYDCQYNCSSNCHKAACQKDSENGACVGGCKAGFQGHNCTKECDDGFYGYNCYDKCSKNCLMPICKKDSENGTCVGGCKPGFHGENCRKECEYGFYGEKCEKNCSLNCLNPPCRTDSDYGTCTGGCIPGFTGDNCTEECEYGFYGEKCEYNCSLNCLNPPCRTDSDYGTCTGGCIPGFTGDNCTEAVAEIIETVHSTGGRSHSGAIVRVLVTPLAIVVIIVIVAGVFILYLRKRRNNRHANSSFENIGSSVDRNKDADNSQSTSIATSSVKPVLSPKRASKKTHHPTADNSQSSSIATSSVKPDFAPKRVSKKAHHATVGHDAIVATSATRFEVNRIGQYIKEMRQKGNYFAVEYEDIPKTTSPWKYADMPKLKAKNRYRNIMPYDCNRVKLTVQDNEPLSDYINASVIMDYGGKEAYIAAQGATEDTLNDIWRMIWEHKISNIFMVTNLKEGRKRKCEQYWPSNGFANYGAVRVESWNICSENHIEMRSFKVTKEHESRTITQYHYTAWPDKQVPSSPSSILRLRELLKEQRSKGQAPILVHCSAGIGRTGTLIALDILLDQMEREGAVDVYQCVTQLRHQRIQMVQTLVQYRFLYDILHKCGSVGETSLPVKNLKMFMKSNFEVTATKQFQYLEEAKPVFIAEELEFGRIDNKDKNQDLLVVPASDRRIKFSLQPELYVNAVYVEGFNQQKGFCATQIPQVNTIGDFWKVVFQEKCVAVVCLETDSAGTEWLPATNDGIILDGIFVSTDQISTERELDVLDITLMECKESAFLANIAPVKVSEVHSLKVFVLQNWTHSDIAARDKSIIKTVYDSVQKLGKDIDETPTMVMCRNGATESGLYIAATVLLDMVQKTGSVDFVQVVKQIRKNRPQFITNQDQFEWLHGLLLGCTT